MSNPQKFYITTPIYYVNARPHIGHAYTTIVCDAVARRKRTLGIDTFFLTGTDEHGQKIERSATAAGKTYQQFTDDVSAEFRNLWDRMGITYDGFIRTTDEHHQRGVREIFNCIRENGFIYKGSYTGQYCVFDELYVNEGGPGTPCPDCGRPTETLSEENYFFKLSAFADKLLKFYEENPGFIRPESRRNEVISFVKSGLRDLSISRTSLKWGIPVPGDPRHLLYVWFDAVCNYATAVGFGSSDAADKERFRHYWPADVHVIGKEIVRFHAVYWPAFLMAAGLETPRSIQVHGWLLFEEDKISKSRGNIVRAETIIDALGADALRYFLLREVVFGQDGSFSFDALVTRYNADLANGLGNVASRTLAMISRYFHGEIPSPSKMASHSSAADAVIAAADDVIRGYGPLFDQYQFSRALESVWTLISEVNKFLVETAPWSLAGDSSDASQATLGTILYTSAEALRIATALLYPIIPDSAARIWTQLGLGDIRQFPLANLQWGQLPPGTKLGKIEAVFPRADKSMTESMKQSEEENSGASLPGAPATAPEAAPAAPSPLAAPVVGGPSAGAPAAIPAAAPEGTGRISIDDFARVELRVGLVKSAEKVKNADKLLRLEVDIGSEVRQIVAGIAEAYAPEALVGRKVVIVANLAPRKLRGIESNGMIVAASVGEKGLPVLAGFLEDVPVGARLK